jgi:hypothetical protein
VCLHGRTFQLRAVASSPSVIQALRYYAAQRVAIFTPYGDCINVLLWEADAAYRDDPKLAHKRSEVRGERPVGQVTVR